MNCCRGQQSYCLLCDFRWLVFLIAGTLTVLTPAAANQRDVELARRILIAGMDSRNSDTRVQAVIASSMIGKTKDVVERLNAGIDDRDVSVRLACVRALADLKSYESRPQLRNVLRSDKVPEVAFAAAKALYALGDPTGKRALVGVFEKKIDPTSSLMQTEARHFFHNFRSPQAAVFFIVTQGIGYVPVPGVGEGFSAMMAILRDPNLSARASVLLLLGQEKGSEARRLLEDGLRDNDWSVRAAAAQTIAHTGRFDLAHLLPPLFNDKKDKVRFRAAGAYLHLMVKKSS